MATLHVVTGDTSAASAPVQLLLSRLQNVRRYGDGWRAACPAHDSKSRSSLSITEGADGRILMHCFGGCETLDILKVCGLEASDLFPERITHNATPEQRREIQNKARIAKWAAALSVLRLEARVIYLAAQQIKDGDPLNDIDQARLRLSMDRIVEAGRALDGR